MKYRNAGFLIVSIMILLVSSIPVQAQEIPVELKLEYIDSQEQVLVSIITSEPVVLEAFTFSIMFDNEVYKLHKGYDKLQNGYGYSQEFREHQGNAMMLSNALDNKVIFSGVNDSQENNAYSGVIAQAAFLQYNNSQDIVSKVWLEISALHINGENIILTDANKQMFHEGNVEYVKENELQTGGTVDIDETEPSVLDTLPTDSQSFTKTEVPAGEGINSQYLQSHAGTESTVPQETETNKIKVNETENIISQSTITSQSVTSEAVSGAGINKTESLSKIESSKKTDKEKKQKYSFLGKEAVVIVAILVVCFVTGGIVLIYKKRKRSD